MMLLGLMTGVRDHKLKQEFLRQENPTTEALVRIAENWERSDKLQKSLNPHGGSRQDYARIDRTESNYKAGQKKAWQHGRRRSPSKPPKDQNKLCKKCGKGEAKCKGRDKCPAFKWKCKICERICHFPEFCYLIDQYCPSPGVGKGSQSGKSHTR